MSALQPGVRVHIVGIAGAGMSAMALLLGELGAVVSGSDAHESSVLDELRARHITVDLGHDGTHVDGAEVVLGAPAVATDNVELVAARDAGAEMMTRARAFDELSSMKRVIGFTGTHGK